LRDSARDRDKNGATRPRIAAIRPTVSGARIPAVAHSRRDFLLLRPGRQARVLDLPCRRLYMRYVEARTSAGRDAGDWPLEAGAEPPSDVATPTVDELFATLDRELQEADAVRLVEAEWLAEPDLRLQLDRVLDAFRERGGEVR
jgi:hypothetical protein